MTTVSPLSRLSRPRVTPTSAARIFNYSIHVSPHSMHRSEAMDTTGGSA